MPTQRTPKLGLPYPQKGDASWDVPLNSAITQLDTLAALSELDVSLTENPSTTLRVDIAAGTFRNAAGQMVEYAGASNVALTASSTNYLYLTDAGSLVVNTTGFPANTNVVTLAVVTTDSDSVTDLTDARAAWESAGGPPVPFVGSGPSHAGGAVPDPGSSAGNTRFLNETGGWATALTSVALAAPGIFTVSGSPQTTAGTITLALATQAATKAFLGPASGVDAAPTFRLILGSDLPVFVGSGTGHGPGAVPDPGGSAGTSRFLNENGTWMAPVGSGTVTSVALALGGGIFTISGSPVTGAGTLTGSLANQTTNTAFMGPASGPSGAPTFRAIVPNDLPVFVGSGPSHAAGVVPDPGASAGSTRFLCESGTWTTTGTVTTVSVSVPAWLSGVVSNPSSNPSILITANTQTANTIFAGPPSGAVAAPGFRAMVGADIPVFVASGVSHAPGGVPDPGASAGTTKFLREDATWQPVSVAVFGASGGSHSTGAVPDPGGSAGTAKYLREDATWATPPGTGTVTSVAITVGGGIFSAAGSPITTSGTLALSLATQSANTALLGPASGAAAAPTFRAPVGADAPLDPLYTETDGATVAFNWLNGRRQRVTIAGNRAVALSNMPDGSWIKLIVKQGAAGPWAVSSWSPSGLVWMNGGTTPTQTTTTGKSNVYLIERISSTEHHGYVIGNDG